MRRHALEFGREETLVCRSPRYLALLDLATYPHHVGPEADHLDLEAHLMRQRDALVGITWSVPDRPVRLRLRLARDAEPVQALAAEGPVQLDGWLRTLGGRLLLSNAERLHAEARDPAGKPVRGRAGLPTAHTLLVPPGLYAVHIARHRPAPGEAVDSLVLRHYPFPAPRVAPVRLGGLIPWASSMETSFG